MARFLDFRLSGLIVVALVTMPPAYGGQNSSPERDPEFTRLDANGDGFLSRSEAGAIPHFGEAFTAADDDGDGKLDPDEFATAQAIHARIQAQQYVDDSLITAKIKIGLLKDSRVQALGVKVRTQRGTVLLTGTVGSVEQVRSAAEIASGVRGVVAVENHLEASGKPLQATQR